MVRRVWESPLQLSVRGKGLGLGETGQTNTPKASVDVTPEVVEACLHLGREKRFLPEEQD